MLTLETLPTGQHDAYFLFIRSLLTFIITSQSASKIIASRHCVQAHIYKAIDYIHSPLQLKHGLA